MPQRPTSTPVLILLLALGGGLPLAGVLSSTAAAQTGDDDAGVIATGDEDAGMTPVVGQEGGIACSCETLEPRNGQRIHVCTGSFDPDVCEQFSCESSYTVQRPCTAQGVRLCCQMDSRSLYTNLYEDCEHDNCEEGFRAQCNEFGGTVIRGLCGGQQADAGSDRLPPAPTEKHTGFCSVSRVSAAPTSAWWLLGLATVVGIRRRRRTVVGAR